MSFSVSAVTFLLACTAVRPCLGAVESHDLETADRLAPQAFRAAVDCVMPSVVTIETFGGLVGTSGPKPRGQTKRPRPRRSAGISRPGEGPTTGLIVSRDGYILTSTYNFIRKPSLITVVLHDGTQHIAKLLGRDRARGLCLLKIDDVTELNVPIFVPRRELGVGQWTISVGVGYGGGTPAISVGILSATRRIFGRAVQTDANISPANYGGPLVDLDGRVIGICVALSPNSFRADAGVQWYDSGIGFAVPYPVSPTWLGRLKRRDIIQRGKLGVRAQPNDELGVKVLQAIADSPAAKAGVRQGDVIVAMNGQHIADMTAFRSILGQLIEGDTVKLKIQRGDKSMILEISLEAGPGRASQNHGE